MRKKLFFCITLMMLLCYLPMSAFSASSAFQQRGAQVVSRPFPDRQGTESLSLRRICNSRYAILQCFQQRFQSKYCSPA